MASYKLVSILVLVVTLLLQGNSNYNVVEAQLSPNFYARTCPMIFPVVGSVLASRVSLNPRMGASILRLFFLDCFVNGCDASVLLDDTASFTGEQNAAQNRNSARGVDVIDDIKNNLERVCPGVVSCADILAIAARDSVVSLGGPNWQVLLGRRDSTTASQAAADSSIPKPTSSLSELITSFNAVGLSTRDMVALSGAHTIGQARCTNFRSRIYNGKNIDSAFATTRQQTCPRTSGSGDEILAPLDATTPTLFDNSYFRNLVNKKGLLHSDQELFNGGSTDAIVRAYSNNLALFRSDFASAMLKMGSINPLTGSAGEIRRNCGRVN